MFDIVAKLSSAPTQLDLVSVKIYSLPASQSPNKNSLFFSGFVSKLNQTQMFVSVGLPNLTGLLVQFSLSLVQLCPAF
jgi:hypothetical protein